MKRKTKRISEQIADKTIDEAANQLVHLFVATIDERNEKQKKSKTKNKRII